MRVLRCKCSVGSLWALLFCCGALAQTENDKVFGHVTDEAGRPLSGVEILLMGPLVESQNGSNRTDRTDAFGIFRFLGLASGSYLLVASKAAFVPISQDVELSESTDIAIAMQAMTRLTIRNRITVVGNPSEVDHIPGSGFYLEQDELAQRKTDVDDIHHLLRQAPGINIQEEEGYGLRPNIGMRGSGVERSAKITLMEDGVLIAPAPYAAPAAYYFPTAGRMQALEVLKGSSQIRHGPNTNGGALNLLSTSIPTGFRLQGNLAGGQDRTGKLHVNAGDSYQNFGWMLETYQIDSRGFKRLDGGGDTGFRLGDYLAKFRVHSGGTSDIYQEFEFKVGHTHQDANETYLGLTDEDFAENSLRRYRASQRDLFVGRHSQIQGRYFIAPSSRFDVTATVYRNDFDRNWYKLQSVLGTGISSIFDDLQAHEAELAIVQGSESDPDALVLRANNREYYSQGIQTVVGVNFDRTAVQNRFQIGLRYHQDQEDRLQFEDGFQMMDGNMILTSKGAPGSQSNRVGDAHAWAVFVQDRLEWGRLALIPGLRYEKIELTRTDFSTQDPNRDGSPTRVRTNGLDVWVPGIGLSFDVRKGVNLFGGIHKGFSPPGPGSNEDTMPEESVNYELGLRLKRQPFSFSLAGFFNDYENLLGADTLSSGGTGEGDLFNGGAARVSGLEAAGAFDLGTALGSSFAIPAQFAYTLTHGEFRNSFQSAFDPWGDIQLGDEIPYLPRQQLYASIGLERGAWKVRTEVIHGSRMRTEAGQGPMPERSGTDSHVVWGLTGEYALSGLAGEKWGASLFVSARNLLDARYIVARRPAGVRPGLPRTIMAGIRFYLTR